MIHWTPRRGAATASIAVGWLLVAGAAALYSGSAQPADAAAAVLRVQGLVGSVVVGGLGWFIAWRRPASPIGWLILGGAVASNVATFTEAYAKSAFASVPPRLPFADPMAIAYNATWSLYVPFLLLVFLLFPDGRLLSPRWRPVAWCAALTAPAVIGLTLVWPTAEQTFGVPAPFAVTGQAGEVVQALGSAVIGAMVLLFVATAGGLVLRFRRARGIEREQLKWLTYAGVLVVSAFLLTLPVTTPWTYVLFRASIYFLCAAIAIAILRYRLYDIDVLINRTLVYGATTAGIGLAFFGGIVALQAVLRPVTSGSEVAVAVSTLVSFALFQPLRGRVQAAVDRRFDRSHYDAARTVDEFTARLRDQVDLDALRADLVRTASDAVQPAHAGVWLRERMP